MSYSTSQSFSFRAMLRQVEQAHAEQLARIDELTEALRELLSMLDGEKPLNTKVAYDALARVQS